MLRIWIGIVPAMVIAHLTAASLFGASGYGLSQMWEITPLQTMWLQTAFIIAYAARIPVGVFAANIARDRTVFLGAFLLSIIANAVFFFFVNDFTLAIILRVIAGAAAGAMVIPALNIVTVNGKAVASIVLALVIILGWSGSVYLSQLAGQFNISVLSDLVPPGGGWNTIFMVSAIFGAIWLLPVFFLLGRKK